MGEMKMQKNVVSLSCLVVIEELALKKKIDSLASPPFFPPTYRTKADQRHHFLNSFFNEAGNTL